MNGLRGVAALAILTTHVWDYGTPPRGGRIGVGFLFPVFAVLGLAVALFFTLSGFLLYRRFAAAILGVGKRPGVRAYARARFFRIVPPYWFILGIVGILFGATLVPTPTGGRELGYLPSHPRAMAADFLFAQNYMPSTNITGIGSAWTLLNEDVFYLTLPLLSLPLILLARRAVSERTRVVLALTAPLTLFVIGLACKRYGELHLGLGPDTGWDANWRSVFQRSFLYQADLFTAGMSAAVVSVLIERGTVRISRRLRTYGLIVAALIFLAVPVLARHRLYPGVIAATTVTISFGLLLIALASGGKQSKLARLLNWRPLASVGLISYSLFLWHEPVVRWLNAHGLTHAGQLGLALNVLIVASISLTLATISYLAVERPSMALRKRAPRPEPVPAVTVPADAA